MHRKELLDHKLDRRQALGALAAVRLSGLLAACGGDGTETTSAVTTSTGETARWRRRPRRRTAHGRAFDSSATCQVATELTEGPYYFDVDSIRSDLREDREGTLLRLACASATRQLRGDRERGRRRLALRRERVLLGLRVGLAGRARAAAGAPTTRRTCAAPRPPTATASPSSRRSTPGGIRAARRTSTSRSTSTARRC